MCPKAVPRPPFVSSGASCVSPASSRPWLQLLTHPSDYAEEAAYDTRVIEAACTGTARTVLELGSGGGNNASHLKTRFDSTLTDLSPEMLVLSETVNPECEHVRGDMRAMRLGRTFDGALVHDAAMSMATEDDLHAAVRTAIVHLRPGGAAVLVPDVVRETLPPGVHRTGPDGPDGRVLRFLEWTHDPDPGNTTCEVDFAIVLREPERRYVSRTTATSSDFPRATWRALVEGAGLGLVDPPTGDPYAEEHDGSRRASPSRLTPSERTSTLGVEHTFVIDTGDVMLTTRQQEIWQFLAAYVDEHGYPPTVREIGHAVGLASPSTVHAHLASLEREGLIRRDPTKPRALELVGRQKAGPPSSRQAVPTLPLVGRIAAGGPLLAEESIEDEIAVPEPLGRDADFLLRVTGDSMIEAGILDGDVVVVRRQEDARTGDVVVALVGDDETADEATVKTFHRESDGRVRLQPENSALEPLYPEHVQILGKVTGVFRSLG